MKKFWTKAFTLMIALLMAFTVLPAAVHAESDEGDNSVLTTTAAAEEDTESKGIIVLYTNDVHCGIGSKTEDGSLTGYAVLAAEKQDLIDQGYTVFLVDNGDAIQGESIGSLTQGKSITELMNAAGYDVAGLGNHEFDYTVPVLMERVSEAEFPYISANFVDLSTGEPAFNGYQIFEADGHKIAFVGISTPETYTKSTPTYFKDADGNWVYSFSEDTLYETVQKSVDAAKAEGADVVIAVGHTGMEGTKEEWNTESVIKNTNGIDAYIDGHAHEVIVGPKYEKVDSEGNVTESKDLLNKDGEAVPETSTGTKLANIGKMTLSFDDEGNVSVATELLATEEVDTSSMSEAALAKGAEVQKLINNADAYVEELLGEVVGTTEVDLIVNDPESGVRIVRNSETNLGDLVADAFRNVLDADIAFVNGGGVRATIPAGDITLAQLNKVSPFGNEACVIEVSGQTILDALEHGARSYPDELGGFPQVSGIEYTIDATVESPVITNEKGEFQSIDDSKPRRIKDVKVGGEDLDPEKTYKLAGTNYVLLNGGDGYTMFAANGTLISKNGLKDYEIYAEYIKNTLGGKVTAEDYGNPYGAGRIKVAVGETAVYRVYNPNSGEHLYTIDEEERETLIGLGWDDEEIGWYAPTASSTGVTRLYNPNAGEHHYTADKTEISALEEAGWTNEGVKFYSDDAKAVKLYREYNPNAYANNHNMTTDENEHTTLVGLGWLAEDNYIYAVKAGK